MTDSYNHLPDDPSAQAGSIDPTLHGNPEHTITLLTEEQRWQVEERMDSRIARNQLGLSEGQYWQGSDAMALEEGVRLTQQCNSNYAYLNRQGISMTQFVGVLEGFRESVLSAPRNEIDHTNSNGGWERAGLSRTMSGLVINPLNGERGPNTEYTLTGPDLWDPGVMDIEVEMARVGIFNATRHSDSLSEVTCRAEQILACLGHTEIGQQLLRAQGIGDDSARYAEQPIALAAVPEGPSPRDVWEQEKAAAEQKALQDNLGITATLSSAILALKSSAPKGSYKTWDTYDRDKGGKGKASRMFVSDDSKTGTSLRSGKPYGYTVGTFVEVTEWKKPPYNEFKIIQSQKKGDAYETDTYSTVTLWELGTPARHEWKEQPRGGRSFEKEKRSRILSVNELDELSGVIVEPNRQKLAQWEATQTKRSHGVGRLITSILTRR